MSKRTVCVFKVWLIIFSCRNLVIWTTSFRIAISNILTRVDFLFLFNSASFLSFICLFLKQKSRCDGGYYTITTKDGETHWTFYVKINGRGNPFCHAWLARNPCIELESPPRNPMWSTQGKRAPCLHRGEHHGYEKGCCARPTGCDRHFMWYGHHSGLPAVSHALNSAGL